MPRPPTARRFIVDLVTKLVVKENRPVSAIEIKKELLQCSDIEKPNEKNLAHTLEGAVQGGLLTKNEAAAYLPSGYHVAVIKSSNRAKEISFYTTARTTTLLNTFDFSMMGEKYSGLNVTISLSLHSDSDKKTIKLEWESNREPPTLLFEILHPNNKEVVHSEELKPVTKGLLFLTGFDETINLESGKFFINVSPL